MDETNTKDRRLKGNEMSEVYKHVSNMVINRHSYNSQTGVKNKIEVGFIEMIKSMKNRDLCQAKLPPLFDKLLDIQRYDIKNRNQIFVLLKDFSVIREREKAMIQT